MTFEDWWQEHGSMFTTPEQAAGAAWSAAKPPARVAIEDPDYPGDASRTMWCDACVAEVACPQCESPAGVPCKGAALHMPRRPGAGHGNGKRYIVGHHYLRRDLYLGRSWA